jgi:DNA repair protein RecO (recombination protein O)
MSRLQKTEVVVLSSIKYRDTSLIVNVFAKSMGNMTFIVNGVRSVKSKMKASLFQPCQLLDIVFYENKKGDLHRLSECKSTFAYSSIPFDVAKSSIVLFLSEILNKSLKSEGENESLFEFIKHAFIFLDQSVVPASNFHLRFLLKMSVYLGFGADQIQETVQQIEQQSNKYVSDRNVVILEDLMNSDYGQELDISKQERAEILDLILAFYRLHLDSLIEVKSLAVLREVLQ